jgi:phage gp36-like protein
MQNNDLARLTPDALVALRERYAGPSMDALRVVVNRCCDGVQPTTEEYQAAMQQADKVNKREEVLRLLKKIAVERNRWRRNRSPRRVNHWRQA